MSNNEELKKYLLKNPWPEEFYSRTQINYFYNFNIEIPPHELWPLISDSSEINRLLKLQRMYFEEKNGKLSGRGKILIFNHEWEEIPWEWESLKEMKTSRVYTKGFASYLRVHFFLFGSDHSSSRLTVYMGWIPRNFAGYLILKIAEKTLEKRFRNMLAELKNTHQNKISFNILEAPERYAVLKSSGIEKNHEEKLSPIRDYLIDQGIESSLIDRLLNYILHSTDDTLYRIKPKILSEIFGIELEKLISVLLHAARCGLLNLSWDIVCPHCRGVREKHPHLWTVESKAACEVCDIEFSTGGMNIIEVTFSVNPGIRKVEKILYCSAEPSKKPHILLQKNLFRGNTFSYTIPQIEKRLRFRTKGKKSYGILDVDSKSSAKSLYWDDLNSSSVIKCSPGSTVFIKNSDNDNEQYIIELSEDDQTALRPSDLFNFSEFREIFSDETLAYGISIDIGVQNILFIDIVGSTEYYKNSGDTEAFKTIRKYFVKVNDIAKAYKGVIVKTIGDAVMLSFSNPLDALRCSIKLITVFDGSDSDVPLMTRITINRGSCLAVNLDTLIDYFGQTVNVASKLQGFTDAGEITLSEDFVNEAAVSRYLKDKNYTFKTINKADIKGAGEILYRKIRIKKLPK